MKNIGIQWILKADCDSFTSDFVIKVRRIIGKPLRFIIRLALKHRPIIDTYPKLIKGKPYIFASAHFWSEDIAAGVSCIDRNAYALIGSTNSVEVNPMFYAAWLNGVIYVDRLNAKSRSDALPKMERILRSGSSVLIYPEGGWNNTENLLCNPLFAGVYTLAKKTGAEIVPICSFPNKIRCYFNGSAPISVGSRSKEEVLQELRDALGTLVWESITKYTQPIDRASLSENCRVEFMQERLNQYLTGKWSRDVWDEELTVYKDKTHPSPEEVRRTLKNVKVTNIMHILFCPF